MRQPGFINFCNDFKVPLSGIYVTEAYKKSALANATLEYEQFNSSITKIGTTINKARAAEKKKAILAVKAEQKRRVQPAPKSKRTELDDESVYSGPQWNTSFKNKYAGKSDEDLREDVHNLYTEMKTLEAVKPEVARMMVVDHLELTDAEKYRPKMVGYVGYNNFEVLDNINQTKQLLKAKDSQS